MLMTHVLYPQKRALLIGINTYPNFSKDLQLKGCLNDVELMRDTLQNIYSFPEQNVISLLNQEATRAGILDAMQILLRQVEQDDIIVFYYSGHGSKVLDLEGDEPDGWDETITPYDAGHSPLPFREITDDEIYVWLLLLTRATPHITLIVDSCYSGSISRASFGDATRSLEPDDRPINERPSSPIPREMLQRLVEGRRHVGESGWLPFSQRYTLIAGCRHNEKALEMSVEGSKYGMMTYFLNRELQRAETGATYRDIFERMSIQVTAVNRDQHPQMEGAKDRELFSWLVSQPMRFVPVQQRAGNIVTLRAGAAHGMSIQSLWDIYPQGTKDTTGSSVPMGKIEIIKVYATTSEASILSETKRGAITTNTRAVEAAHCYGDMRLSVYVHPSSTRDKYEELTRNIDASLFLARGEKAEKADLCIYLVPPRAAVTPASLVPQLGPLSEAAWAIVGRNGRLAAPMHRASEPGVMLVLCSNLEKIARYRHTVTLKNDSVANILHNKIEFTLLRQATDNSWQEAVADPRSGQILYVEGERIAARIVNRHSSRLYVSVLDFGLTGRIAQLYPIEGANEALEPNIPFYIGTRGEDYRLSIPDGYPFTVEDDSQTFPGDMEVLKLIATTHEADFSPLIQGVLRSSNNPPDASPLYRLLERALLGRRVRDIASTRIPVSEAWTTVERCFLLLRS